MATTKTPRTTTKSRPKARRALKAAFVVTASLGAGGCDWGGTTNPPPTNPPFIDCPSSVPTEGAACEPPDDGSCTYPDDCNLEIIASCTEGSWEVEYSGTCNPPPPGECPEELPFELDNCSEPMSCDYQDECGQDIQATCDGSEWSVSEPMESCNPPAPCPQDLPAMGSLCEEEFGPPEGCSWEAETSCGPATVTGECSPDEDGSGYVWELTAPPCTPEVPACSQYENAGLCDADTTCRWLVPGCSEEPKPEGFATGCYPIDNCTAESCGEDSECTSVSYNPCWNELCDACGADARICLPFMGGG